MTALIPSKEPAEFTIGDTLKFTKELSDYLPTDGWTLTYTLINSSAKISFSGSDNGDGTHLINVAPATTATWTAGEYDYQAKVADGTDTYLVGTGEIKVVADFAANTTLDARHHVEKALASIEAVIEDRAGESDLSYSIGSRSLSKMTLAELLEFRDKYKMELRRIEQAERVANGLNPRRQILTRFS